MNFPLLFPRRMVCSVWILSTGCASDHGFAKASIDPHAGSRDIDFSIDVALQRSMWGGAVGRCHIQAALRLFEPQDEDMKPFANSQGTVLDLPNEPLACAHTAISEPGEPIDVGGADDNWSIAGDPIASDEIFLLSDKQDIVLRATELTSGGARYEWQDCNPDLFPFGTVFDLHLPTSADALVPGFTVESAFAVGADVAIVEPDASGPHFSHNQADDLDMAWVELQDITDVRGEEVGVERVIWARNRRTDQHQPFEALACLPEDNGMTIQATQLARLEANPEHEEANLLLGVQVDTVVTSPEFQTPWGRTISVRSTVSDGGDIILWNFADEQFDPQ